MSTNIQPRSQVLSSLPSFRRERAREQSNIPDVTPLSRTVPQIYNMFKLTIFFLSLALLLLDLFH